MYNLTLKGVDHNGRKTPVFYERPYEDGSHVVGEICTDYVRSPVFLKLGSPCFQGISLNEFQFSVCNFTCECPFPENTAEAAVNLKDSYVRTRLKESGGEGAYSGPHLPDSHAGRSPGKADYPFKGGPADKKILPEFFGHVQTVFSEQI